MKTLNKVLLIGLLVTASAFGQLNSLVQTSLSSAITATQTVFNVASATGINAPTASVPGSVLYVFDIGQQVGETMTVISLSSTQVTVSRTSSRAKAHINAAVVLVATAPNWFYTVNPSGSCVTASTYVSPYLNTTTGQQWKCSTKSLSWVPHWSNKGISAQALTATATASVAGATAINGPFVHISGTEAITSFTMATGWNGDDFCVYPDAAFTVTATNNIAKAATAVADRTLCFKYDSSAAKFAPSY